MMRLHHPEGDRIMKIARFLLGALVGVMVLAPAAMADLPDGKIAVVRVTAVDGLAHHSAERTERSSVFAYDGTEYAIDSSALSSLDGVKTLLLIDRRTDKLEKDAGVETYSQEVRAFNGTSFEVKDLEGKVLAYQVAMLGGNLRLLGDGDQIMVKGGSGGPYQVWRVDRIDLVDHQAVVLQ